MEKGDVMEQMTPEESLDMMVSTEDSNSTSQHRKVKRRVPEREKDCRYWEKRKRNNLAAKRSRENKRLVENNIRHKVAMLEEENALLRKEVSVIKSKFGIPPNHSVLTEEEIEQCRAEVAEAMKSAQAAEAVSVASASPPPDSTSPHSDMGANHPGNHINYRYPFPRELDMDSEERHVNKKSNKFDNYYQKDTVPRNPTPQTLYYNQPSSAPLMVTSTGTGSEMSSAGKIQQFANPAPGYYISQDQLSNGQSPHFYGQFARFSNASSTPISHPFEYFWPYGKNNNPYPSEFAPTCVPADLSTPKEKLRNNREVARFFKHESFESSARSGNPKLGERESISASTLLGNKRPLSVELNDANSGLGVNNAQIKENSTEAHPVYLLPNQNSHMRQHGYEEESADIQDRFLQQERIANRNPKMPRRFSEDNNCNGNFLQNQSGVEGERLRRENDDLKMRLRQLSTQVSKMKDIVLPE